MDTRALSAVAALFSFLTALTVAIMHWRREKRQRVFDLYPLWSNLKGFDSQDHENNIRLFNLINYTARLLYHQHINKTVFIDLFGSTYLELMKQLKKLDRLHPESPQTVKQMLDSVAYRPLEHMRMKIEDTITAQEYGHDNPRC